MFAQFLWKTARMFWSSVIMDTDMDINSITGRLVHIYEVSCYTFPDAYDSIESFHTFYF